LKSSIDAIRVVSKLLPRVFGSTSKFSFFVIFEPALFWVRERSTPSLIHDDSPYKVAERAAKQKVSILFYFFFSYCYPVVVIALEGKVCWIALIYTRVSDAQNEKRKRKFCGIHNYEIGGLAKSVWLIRLALGEWAKIDNYSIDILLTKPSSCASFRPSNEAF
jgi:hypothetical protein